MKLLNLNIKHTGDKLSAEEFNRIGATMDENTQEIESQLLELEKEKASKTEVGTLATTVNENKGKIDAKLAELESSINGETYAMSAEIVGDYPQLNLTVGYTHNDTISYQIIQKEADSFCIMEIFTDGSSEIVVPWTKNPTGNFIMNIPSDKKLKNIRILFSSLSIAKAKGVKLEKAGGIKLEIKTLENNLEQEKGKLDNLKKTVSGNQETNVVSLFASDYPSYIYETKKFKDGDKFGYDVSGDGIENVTIYAYYTDGSYSTVLYKGKTHGEETLLLDKGKTFANLKFLFNGIVKATTASIAVIYPLGMNSSVSDNAKRIQRISENLSGGCDVIKHTKHLSRNQYPGFVIDIYDSGYTSGMDVIYSIMPSSDKMRFDGLYYKNADGSFTLIDGTKGESSGTFRITWDVRLQIKVAFYAITSTADEYDVTLTMFLNEGMLKMLNSINSRTSEIESKTISDVMTRNLTFQPETQYPQYNYTSKDLVPGKILKYQISPSVSAQVFEIYSDGTNKRIANGQSGEAVLTDRCEGSIRYLFNRFSEETSVMLQFSILSDMDILKKDLETAKGDISILEGGDISALFVGDSYSQMAKWIEGLKKYINVSKMYNLATSSATLKDIRDHNVYAYTDRPYQDRISDETGDPYPFRSFASQIEWLKRLKRKEYRGKLYTVEIKDLPASESVVSFDFPGIGTYTVNVSASESKESICTKIAALNVPKHRIRKPKGVDYIEIECLDNNYTRVLNISNMNAVISIKRTEETNFPFLDDYPDVIVIAGSKNDDPDSQEKVSAYTNNIVTRKDGVYVSTYGSSPSKGTMHVLTPMENVDRSSFTGALVYLMRELHAIFPKSLFLICGTSNITYPSNGIDKDKQKDDQMSLSAGLLSTPYVSWFKEGNVNRIFNYPGGDGTLENPYNNTTVTQDTVDSMHPNDNGGLKLAIPVYGKLHPMLKYIKQIRKI